MSKSKATGIVLWVPEHSCIVRSWFGQNELDPQEDPSIDDYIYYEIDVISNTGQIATDFDGGAMLFNSTERYVDRNSKNYVADLMDFIWGGHDSAVVQLRFLYEDSLKEVN